VGNRGPVIRRRRDPSRPPAPVGARPPKGAGPVTGLSVDVRDARVDAGAAVPTITLTLDLLASDPVEVRVLALSCQVRIEPQKRRYSPREAGRLRENSGSRFSWGSTLRPFVWTHASAVVPAFVNSTEVDLPLTCSYDLEVAGSTYFGALEHGVVPLVLLFSGTVFTRARPGLEIEAVPWDLQATYRMPVALWRQAMDTVFPDCAWVRVRRETFEGLLRWRAAHGLATWDSVLDQLIDGAREPVP
jgi:hypothetical protein